MGWTPEKSLAEMDSNGVAAAVVSVTQPGIWYIEYEFRRLYYDTASAANRPAMAALTSLVPISQVLFGTDYPFVHSIARTLEGLKTVGFSEAELQAIERDNALALLPRFKAAVAAA